MIIPVCKDINPSFLNTVRENCNTLKEVEQIYRYGIDRLKEEVISEENGETLIDIQKTLAAPAPYTLLFEILRPYGFNATQIEDILESSDAIPGKQFEAEEYLLTKGRIYWRLFNILEKETNALFWQIVENTTSMTASSSSKNKTSMTLLSFPVILTQGVLTLTRSFIPSYYATGPWVTGSALSE